MTQRVRVGCKTQLRW